MCSIINPGNRVNFTTPPPGIPDLEYDVLEVCDKTIPWDRVCILCAAGIELIAALCSELSIVREGVKQ